MPLIQRQERPRIAQPPEPSLMTRPGRYNRFMTQASLLSRGITRPNRPATYEEIRSVLETGLYNIDERYRRLIQVTPANVEFALSVLSIMTLVGVRPTLDQLSSWLRGGRWVMSVLNYLRKPFTVTMLGYIIYKELLSELEFGDPYDGGSDFDKSHTEPTESDKKKDPTFIATIVKKDLSEKYPQCKRRWYRKEDGTLTSVIECKTEVDGYEYKRYYQNA